MYSEKDKNRYLLKNLANLDILIEALSGVSNKSDSQPCISQHDAQDELISKNLKMSMPKAMINSVDSFSDSRKEIRRRISSKDRKPKMITKATGLGSLNEVKIDKQPITLTNISSIKKIASLTMLKSRGEVGSTKAELFEDLSAKAALISHTSLAKKTSFKIFKKTASNSSIDLLAKAKLNTHEADVGIGEKLEVEGDHGHLPDRKFSNRQGTQITFKASVGADLSNETASGVLEISDSQCVSSQYSQDLEQASKQGFKKKPEIVRKSLLTEARGQCESNLRKYSQNTVGNIETQLVDAYSKPIGQLINKAGHLRLTARDATPDSIQQAIVINKLPSISTGKEEDCCKASYSSKHTEFQKPSNFAEQLNKLIAQKKQSERQSYRHFNRETEYEVTAKNERRSYRDPRTLIDPRAGIREDMLARQARDNQLKQLIQEDSSKMPSGSNETRKEASDLNTSSDKQKTSEGGNQNASEIDGLEGHESKSESCNRSEQMIFIEQSPTIAQYSAKRAAKPRDYDIEKYNLGSSGSQNGHNRANGQQESFQNSSSSSHSGHRASARDVLIKRNRNMVSQDNKHLCRSPRNTDSEPKTGQNFNSSGKKSGSVDGKLNANAFYSELENINLRRDSADLEDQNNSLVSHNSSFKY